MKKLDQAVIDLHTIARAVEQTYSVGKLSIDIRKCADRLNDLLKNIEPQPNTAKGDQ